MGSVLCPLLAVTQEMHDRVGDRVRSLQDLGTLQSGSSLSWRLLPTQVVLLLEKNEDWTTGAWIESVALQGDQLRLALSVEWRSGSAQELDALLPEVWCKPTSADLNRSLLLLRQKWNSAHWSQLRQSYGLVVESIALMIQSVPKFQTMGQVVRWMRKAEVCHVLETDWQEGTASGLTPEQKAQLCQAVLEMPNLWHQDYSMTWGLDRQNQFWIVAVAVGETLLALPKPPKDAGELSLGLTRASSVAKSSGIAQILPETFPIGAQPLPPQTIAIVKELQPEAVPLLRSVQAIIVEAPSWNSHGVILARELGIPVMVGVEQATEQISNGEALVLRGLDRPNPTCSLPSHGRKTGLLVNRSQLAFRDEWTEDLGLVRSEWLLLPEFSPERRGFDGGEFKRLLKARLTTLLESLVERQDAAVLYYRCLNIIEDRETAASMELAVWQEVQHVAWVQGRSLPPIRLILPFVQTLEQFVRWRQDLVALNLAPTMQSWLMAEVPSVVQVLPDYFEAGAMGVVIGLNDLTQWTLGVSRSNPLFQSAMKKPDRALVRSVQQIIHTSQQANKPCWLALSHWSEAWAEVAIEAGVTGLMVERDTALLAAAAIDRLESR